MDFFSHQDRARRSSHLILLAFVIALAMMGLVIHLAVAGLGMLSGHGGSFTEVSTPAAALIGLMWVVMLFGGFFACWMFAPEVPHWLNDMARPKHQQNLVTMMSVSC